MPHLPLPKAREEEAAVRGLPLDPLGVSHLRPGLRHHKLFPLLFNHLLSLLLLQISHPAEEEEGEGEEGLALNSHNPSNSRGHSSSNSKCSDRGVSHLAAVLCRPEPPTATQSHSRSKDQSQAYETLLFLTLLQHSNSNSNSSSNNTMLRTTVLGLLATTNHPRLLHTRQMHIHQWGPVVVGGML